VLTDERTGQTYDYRRKRGVEGSTILTPEDFPAWAKDRAGLWNEVERVEKRKDSQLARDFVISLPHELDTKQRSALLEDFLTRNFLDRGYLCDVAYHAPHGDGDDRNYHAHVMVPMRRLDDDGFAAKKERPNGPPQAHWQAELARWRKDWADTVNGHLEAAGCSERVSHLSLVEQGIDREPEPKQGAIATAIEQAGGASLAGADRRAAQTRNHERAWAANEPGANTSAESEPDNDHRIKPRTGATSGGMVEQQTEAHRRFVANSAELERRRQDKPVNDPSQAPDRPPAVEAAPATFASLEEWEANEERRQSLERATDGKPRAIENGRLR
jgi:ATP-dependent exoDNAse (exonuclease V) alpha subunit